MATYPMQIAGLDRDLPICKVTDDLYIGAFIMFGDAELTVRCAEELLKLADVCKQTENRNLVISQYSGIAVWNDDLLPPVDGGDKDTVRKSDIFKRHVGKFHIV